MFLKAVVARHGVGLPALLAQSHPQPVVLHKHVLDLHGECSPDAGEAVDHERDQRPVAQPGMARDIDAVEQRPCLHRFQHRCFPLFDDVRGSANRGCWIEWHDLPHHQPIEQMADGSETQLRRGRRALARLQLDPGGDMERLDGGDRRHPSFGAPMQEAGDGAAVGAARVRVADVGGEELQKT